MRTLACALIQCHFDYACTSWYRGISKPLKTKLQTSQNKLVRLLKLNPRSHLTSTHFSSLGWLRVEERVSQLSLCLVFKILDASVPKYLLGYLPRVRDAHRYSTRGSSHDLVPSSFRTLKGKNAFYYAATTLWNALPPALKSLNSLARFRIDLKSWLHLHTNWS